MSLRQVLSNIVHGNTDYCCLCYQESTENAVWIHDEILVDVDSQDTRTMSDLINTVFGEDVEIIASAFGMFCCSCKVSIVNVYKFMKRGKENLENLTSVINNMTETFENMLPDVENYNTLYVSIDHDYTSKQFYDDVQINNTTKAFRRFNSIVNPPVTQIKYEENQHYSLKCLMKEVRKASGVKMTKRQAVYDIPSVPTVEIVTNHNSTSYECSVCLKKYYKEREFRQHFFKNHYPRTVKCTKCKHSFITFEMLEQHVEDYHSNGVCSECGKSFTSKSALKKHELNHTLRITCSDCNRVYRSAEAFKKHITDDVCRQKSKKSSDQATFECDYCNKRYCYKPYLAKHIMYEHGSAEGFRCKFCNKQFYTQSRLKIHTYKHTREKNYTCTICDGKFVTRESLLYHTRLHTGERPYACEYCDKAFLSASRRLDHVRRHHMAPSLECDICQAKFKVTGSLLKHRKKHLNPNSKLSNINKHPAVVQIWLPQSH